MLLYHSLFATYLQYGVVCWGTAKSTAMSKIKTLQNKVIRHITLSGRMENVDKFYKTLGILKVEDIHFLEVAKFMYKNTKQTLPHTFSEYYRPIPHHHDTRAKTKNILSIPKSRTNFGKQSIKFTGVKVWSEVPNATKQCRNLDSFSCQVKEFLLGKYS